MEHTSGFRPPGRDVPRARDMKRGKHDHASRNYERHMDERFKNRAAERRATAKADDHAARPNDDGEESEQ